MQYSYCDLVPFILWQLEAYGLDCSRKQVGEIVGCSVTTIKKYDDALALEQAKKEVEIPAIMNYKPSRIESPIKLPSPDDIQKWIVDSKMAKLEDFSGENK